MFPHTDITDYNAAVGSVSPGQDVSPGWMACILNCAWAKLEIIMGLIIMTKLGLPSVNVQKTDCPTYQGLIQIYS